MAPRRNAKSSKGKARSKSGAKARNAKGGESTRKRKHQEPAAVETDESGSESNSESEIEEVRKRKARSRKLSKAEIRKNKQLFEAFHTGSDDASKNESTDSESDEEKKVSKMAAVASVDEEKAKRIEAKMDLVFEAKRADFYRSWGRKPPAPGAVVVNGPSSAPGQVINYSDHRRIAGPRTLATNGAAAAGQLQHINPFANMAT